MSRREADGAARSAPWRNGLTAWILGLVAVAALIFAARRFTGPHDAQAQTPRGRGVTTRIRSNTPPRQIPAPQRGGRPTPGGQAAPARPLSPMAPAGPQQAVVAEVNNERITRNELAQKCIFRFGEGVLESIVNRNVIWQACQQRKITVTDQDVEAEIQRMARRFGMDRTTWLAMLAEKRNIQPDQYRREIVWPTLALRKLAQAELKVSQEDIRKALESEYGPKVRARIIAVRSRKKAEQLLQKVRANPDAFGDIAKDTSEDPNSASARGLIPPIRKHVGDKGIEAAAFALKEGQISDILHVAEQYIIIKCEKIVPQTFLSAQQLTAARERIGDQLRDHKLRESAAKIFRRLQTESRVVNVINNPQLRQRHPGVAALINNRPITIDQLAEECLQRHGSEVVDGEINHRLLLQALKRAGKTISRRDLDLEIERAADSFGFVKQDGSPDVKKWLHEVAQSDQKKIDIYVQDSVWPSAALKKLVTQRIEVSEDDMRKGFEANYGERVEVLAIVVGSRQTAQKVWEMARSRNSDEEFGALANQYSIEPVSKANFGKVPPIRRYAGQEHLEKEAFRLKPGAISGLIVVDDRYIILRCLGRTKPMVTIQEVRKELYRDLHEKKLRIAMAEKFEKLRETSRIQNFLAKKKRKPVARASATLPARRAIPGAATRPGAPATVPSSAGRPLRGRIATPPGRSRR